MILKLAFSRIRQELGLPQQVGFRIIVGGAPPAACVLRWDEVYLIGREALINAFSHSSASQH